MADMPISEPAEVGLNGTQLAKIDRHLEKYVDDGSLAGSCVLIARRGQIAHLGVTGSSDLARGAPMRDDTIFRIYSMTKPITCLVAMQLFEEGRLQLDDRLDRYIPRFAQTGVYSGGALGNFQTTPPARPITLRDLFVHTSGLTYWIQDRSPVDAAYRTLKLAATDLALDEWADKVASLPLEFSPGTAWNYSIAIDILGRVIEVVTGESLDDVFRERIFEPLSMTDTDFYVPSEKAERLAACYQRTAQEKLALVDDPARSPYLARPALLSGGGGLVSTLRDYSRFAQALCNGGRLHGVRLLGRKTLELMTRNHLPGNKDLNELSVSLFSETTMSGIGFGLGVAVTLDPAKAQLPGSPGEFFWGGAASTYFLVDPKEELVVVFMTQLLPSSALNLRRELRAMVYAAIED